MTSFTVPYSGQLAYSQTNTFISHPPFLPTGNTSISLYAVSDDVSDIEILSSYSPSSTAGTQPASTHNQTPAYEYDAKDCAWQYCNATGQSSVRACESCLNQTAPPIKGNCFSVKSNAVKSDSNSVPWRSGKKKKTVSAALLIALGVAGMVMG